MSCKFGLQVSHGIISGKHYYCHQIVENNLLSFDSHNYFQPWQILKVKINVMDISIFKILETEARCILLYVIVHPAFSYWFYAKISQRSMSANNIRWQIFKTNYWWFFLNNLIQPITCVYIFIPLSHMLHSNEVKAERVQISCNIWLQML